MKFDMVFSLWPKSCNHQEQAYAYSWSKVRKSLMGHIKAVPGESGEREGNQVQSVYKKKSTNVFTF